MRDSGKDKINGHSLKQDVLKRLAKTTRPLNLELHSFMQGGIHNEF